MAESVNFDGLLFAAKPSARAKKYTTTQQVVEQ